LHDVARFESHTDAAVSLTLPPSIFSIASYKGYRFDDLEFGD
jgi:hypothetical protein